MITKCPPEKVPIDVAEKFHIRCYGKYLLWSVSSRSSYLDCYQGLHEASGCIHTAAIHVYASIRKHMKGGAVKMIHFIYT